MIAEIIIESFGDFLKLWIAFFIVIMLSNLVVKKMEKWWGEDKKEK